MRWLIGDVRDRDRLHVATRGVDVIVHAAALKQVPACEYNPFEAVQTNVIGAQNVISAAIDSDVPLTIALSTDKAVNPVNLYGATKLCAEKIVAQANVYAGGTGARFACVRYGNVVGSRGSVIPIFKRQALERHDHDHRRAHDALLDHARPGRRVRPLAASPLVQGGEIFVPKIPSMRVIDMAEAIAPDAELRVVGIRPGEKLHEVLLTEDEARNSYDLGDRYVVMPQLMTSGYDHGEHGTRLPDDFRFSSDVNEHWLDDAELRAMADALPPARRANDRRNANPGAEA